MRTLACGLFLLPNLLVAQIAIADAAGAELIAADATVETLCDKLQFCEGPVWIAADRARVFSDIPASKLMRWTAKEGVVEWQASEQANGNTLDLQGRLLSCQHAARNVVRREADGEITVLVDRHDGKRFNSPNDVAVRADGSIWFTDPSYGLGKRAPEQPGNFVYRFDPATKTTTVVQRDFHQPNGLCFSPDHGRLYIADSGDKQRVGAFVVQPDGTLSDPVFWLKGGSDGMRCDERGNLYITARTGVRIYSQEGKLLVDIGLGESPTNCAFGGEDGKTLFVTARKALYRISMQVAGAAIAPKPAQARDDK